MGAKLKRKSFFVDETTLHRAKKAPRARTDAEVIRLSVERIALTARRHGATVVTANLADFEPLARELRIPLLPPTQSPRVLLTLGRLND